MKNITVPDSTFLVLGSGSKVPGPERSNAHERGTQNPEPKTVNLEPGTKNVEPLRFWRTPDELAGDPSFRERLYNEFPSEIEAITDEEWALMVTIRERERTLGEWVGGALGGEEGPGTHAAEHAEQIRAWRAARASPSAP